MEFKVFDPADLVPAAPSASVPTVRVTNNHRLLLNRAAREFLSEAASTRAGRRGGAVQLLFNSQERVAAVRPATRGGSESSVFFPLAMRGIEWPYGIGARDFVRHYRISAGDYVCRSDADRGLLSFEVGPERT